MTRRPVRRLLSSALPFALLVVLSVAGCSDDDASSSDPAPGTTAEAATGAEPVNDGRPTDGGDAGEADDPANPWVLGYRVTGSGAEVNVAVTAYVDGQAQPELTQRPVVGDDPWHGIFTAWVDRLTLDLEVAVGGPVTIEGVTLRHLDPENPFGEVEVRDVHGSITLAPGETGTLEVP